MPRGVNDRRVAGDATYSGDMEASGGASRGETRPRRTRRSRGHIEKLKSGSLRVWVYVGHDKLLRRPLYLKETISAGPDAEETWARAERARDNLLEKVRVGNHPRSDATVDQLWEAYCEKKKWGRKTHDTNTGYYRKHIQPLLGQYKINNERLDGDLIDEFYAELARCRDHCTGSRSTPAVRHWSVSEHRCDQRCKPHICKPLAAWTIRKIHSILNGAFSYARRKKWTLRNPMDGVEPPPAPKGCPQPPTVRETALIIDAAWNGTYYGPAVWFATTTGARLGELCALRWRDLTVQHVDIAHDIDGHDPRDCLVQGCHWVLSISRSIEQVGLEVWEKDTKTHQHRRIALDQEDAGVLIDLRETREAAGKRTGRPARDSDFIIHHPRGPEVPLRPGAVSIHYSRFVATLDVAHTTFHKLRHYSATELVAAGIDINTVAGRLGHASPTTTYNFYAAWKAVLDQQAAIEIHGRVPTPQRQPPGRSCTRCRCSRYWPNVSERRSWTGGSGRTPTFPPMKDLAAEHRVSINAAHAAVNQLAEWGFVTVSRGKRSTVTDPTHWPTQLAAGDKDADQAGDADDPETGQPVGQPQEPVQAVEPVGQPERREALDLEVIRLGQRLRKFRTHADPNNGEELLQLLLDAVRRTGGQQTEIRDYELVVRYAGERGEITTFIAPPNIASILPGVAA